ncbi:hypothetical protein [Roseateles sp.]|uniref:hypothetical protein n=1 Tax=Roseateles sp. TaxID=1971397 RepID=UPI0039EBF7B7
MWLVLCDAHDAAAAWAARQLSACGLQPLEVLSADQLALSDFQEHRLEGRHGWTLRLRTEAGLQVDGASLQGVLNRLYTVPIAHWRQAPEADQAYVQQELVAFFLSWLHALRCPVINRPTPQGLCGPWRMESEWAWLARRAGLPVATYRQTSRDRIDEARGVRRLVPQGALVGTALVTCGRTFGLALPPTVSEACLRLAELSGTSLLGIDFVGHEQQAWSFAGASPTPDLRLGGEALIATLMDALTRHREAA